MPRDKAYYEALHREFYQNRKRRPCKGRKVQPDRIAEGYWVCRGGMLQRATLAQEWSRWRRWCAIIKKVKNQRSPAGRYWMRWGTLGDDRDGMGSRQLKPLFKTARVSLMGWVLVRIRENPWNSAAVKLGYLQFEPTKFPQKALFRLTDKGRRLIRMLE